MFDERMVGELFKNFIKETYKDSLKISFEDMDDVDYRISLNYSLNGKSASNSSLKPILHVGKYKSFISSLTKLFNIKYKKHFKEKEHLGLTKEGYAKYILMSCFINMQELDFNAPVSYFNRIIKSYEQKYEFNKKTKIGEIQIKDEKVNIYEYNRFNNASMESVVSKQFFFEKDGKIFLLPRVHYYISGDCVYIMGIQNYGNKQLYVDEVNEEAVKQNQELQKFHKTMDRYLRKLNKGIDETEINEEGKVDTIKDVSVSSLASLTLFVASLSNYSKFYMPDFLPLRYQNKHKETEIQQEKVDREQTNITDKFLMTGVRLCEHFDQMECGFENGFLEIENNNNTCSNNLQRDVIHELYESVEATRGTKVKIIRK